MGTKIEREKQKIKLHPFTQSIYWKKYIEDKQMKIQKEKGHPSTKSSKDLNDFVLKVVKKEVKLPNIGNLEEAEFVYKNWKITDVNNSTKKILGISEKRGEYKFELMRRMCALGNAGGGILFWGVN